MEIFFTDALEIILLGTESSVQHKEYDFGYGWRYTFDSERKNLGDMEKGLGFEEGFGKSSIVFMSVFTL